MAISRYRAKCSNASTPLPKQFNWRGCNRQVINVTAEMAVKTNDAQLKELLKASGFALGPEAETGKSSK